MSAILRKNGIVCIAPVLNIEGKEFSREKLTDESNDGGKIKIQMSGNDSGHPNVRYTR